MKKFEVLVDDEDSKQLADLLHSLPFVKEVREAEMVSVYTVPSEQSLSEDWLAEEDDELQRRHG